MTDLNPLRKRVKDPRLWRANPGFQARFLKYDTQNLDSRQVHPSKHGAAKTAGKKAAAAGNTGMAPAAEESRVYRHLPADINVLLQPFDPTEMTDYYSCVIYGMRRIGKTVLCKHVLRQQTDRFDEAWLFSKTADLQGDTWDCIHDDYKVIGFDEAKLLQIMQRQHQRVLDAQRIKKESGIDVDIPHVLVLMDDIVSDPAVQRSGILNEVFILGRHRHMSIMILSQNACASGSIGLQARSNVDYVMCSWFNNRDDFDRMATMYFGMEGKHAGIATVQRLTQEPFTFAVANLHKQGRKRLSDFVRTIKAPDPDAPGGDPPFKLGKAAVWAEENVRDPMQGVSLEAQQRGDAQDGRDPMDMERELDYYGSDDDF